MSKRVATITLNPAYDLLGYCANVEPGEVNYVNTLGMLAAGKGINVARVLRGLAMPVTVGGFLGQENAQGFEKLFTELELDNRFQMVEGSNRTNVKLTEQGGQVTDLNFSGFNVTPAEWSQFASDSLQWLSDYDLICISGSLPSGVSAQAFACWMNSLRSQCACLVLDSSGEAFKSGLSARPWLVKPNRHELELCAGRKLPDLTEVIEAASALHQQGIAHVVISLGEQGALWINASGAWLARPPACEVVSTVGAGDSMVGGLIYGLLMQQTSQHTLCLATALATLCVTEGRVGITDREQLSTMMSSIHLQSVTDLRGGSHA